MTNQRNIQFKPRYTIQENSYNDINFKKRTNMFKGTIIICVVYGIVAFLLMASTAFSPSARVILFDYFLPFTLVFIIGTILIISLMVYYIFSYIPVNITYKIDGITCPDYWDVKLLDDNYINNSFDPQYPSSYFKYKCVMNKDIFDTKSMFINSSNLSTIAGKTSNAYKYTNILDTLKEGNNINRGIYDINSNAVFEDNFKVNKDFAKLYKNLNGYSNLDIKQLINSRSEKLSENILDDLKKIAMVQNNYKIDTDPGNNGEVRDLLHSNGIMWNSSSTTSPITWNYSLHTSNSVASRRTVVLNANNSSGIGTTAGSATTDTINQNISAIILDWKDLTPEKAFYNGYDIELSSEDDEKSIKKGLIVYYHPATADLATKSNFNLIGKIEITSNPSSNPTISMNFKPQVYGTFFKDDNIVTTSSDYILNPKHIKISKKFHTNSEYINHAPSSVSTTVGTTTRITYNFTNKIETDINPVLELNNNPIIQLYDKVDARPKNFSKTIIIKSDAASRDKIIPLNCDELYPSLLESMDDDDNNIRCAYSKICNFPWSDLRCPFKKGEQLNY